MSEPAKDEDELVHRVAKAFCCPSPSGCIDNINCDRLDFQIDAIRAIAAIRAAGWAVVPVEATEEIQNAIIDAAFGIECITEDDDAAKIYQAAIKAAAPGLKP